MSHYIQFLAQCCEVLKGCILYFIYKGIFLFGFDKTWSFLMVEGAWSILRKCIMHILKLYAMSYT